MTRLTPIRIGALGILSFAALFLGGLPAQAQEAGLSVELNKLETQASGCRAYLVVNNDSATEYESFRLDLVLFQKNGVIGRRFAMDLAPLKPQKRTVKLFDLDNKCDEIGSFLINDVMECKGSSGPIEDCLARLSVKSLTDVELSK